MIKIKRDDLSDGAVLELLKAHLADMYATSPPESVHALDVNALKAPEITFFSAWLNNTLAGCVALKKHDDHACELKSMRTAEAFRGQGIASHMLRFIMNHAKQQGFTQISLETGTQAYFLPARNLYHKFGFEECGPFGSYQLDPNSYFMTKRVWDDNAI